MSSILLTLLSYSSVCLIEQCCLCALQMCEFPRLHPPQKKKIHKKHIFSFLATNELSVLFLVSNFNLMEGSGGYSAGASLKRLRTLLLIVHLQVRSHKDCSINSK